MKKTICLILLLLLSSLGRADKAIIGYYQESGPYSDYVLVYTYTREDGTIGLSHCRMANSANLQYAFLQQTTLDLNNCDLSYVPVTGISNPNSPAEAPLVNPQTTSGFSTEKAF